MLNLFPRWVQILVAVALAVFAVAEAVPMVLTSWDRYRAQHAEYLATEGTAVEKAKAETLKAQSEANALSFVPATMDRVMPQPAVTPRVNPWSVIPKHEDGPPPQTPQMLRP
jgi:hypothetical protein